MRTLAILLLLCPLLPALAENSDAGRAPPQRWTHPYGPAAGNGRSLARPPESFGGFAWSHEARKPIAAPPVVWDDVIFLLEGDQLVALEAEDGEVLGRAAAQPGDSPIGPVAFRRAAFLVEKEQRISLYRLTGRTLARRWSFDPGAGCEGLCVFLGEIYATTKTGLVRLRAGARRPVWKAEGSYRGQPALFGDHLYALRAGEEGKLRLAVHAREDGRRVLDLKLPATPGPGARVACTSGLVAVRLPGSKGKWAMLKREPKKEGPPALSFVRVETLVGEPLIGRSVLLGVTREPHAWTVLRMDQRPRIPLALFKDRPDLFEGAGGCTLLAGTMCFGTWVGEVNANRILWHIAERPADARALGGGVRFFGVPAGHERLLLVARDGKSLHLVEPEELKR